MASAKSFAFFLVWEFFLFGIAFLFMGAGGTPLPLISALASSVGVTVYDLAIGIVVIGTFFGIVLAMIG